MSQGRNNLLLKKWREFVVAGGSQSSGTGPARRMKTGPGEKGGWAHGRCQEQDRLEGLKGGSPGGTLRKGGED